MDTYKKIVFTGREKVEIEEAPIPKPDSSQLLVKSTYTLISTGTELTRLTGDFPEGSNWEKYSQFPINPGYDQVGEIVEVGDDVDSSLVGKKVASYLSHAEYGLINERSALIIEQDIDDREAVFFTIAHIVMNGMRRGDLKWGETVVVYGLGILGQILTRLCSLAGASKVVGVDLSEKRLSSLPDDDHVIGLNPSKVDVEEKVQELTRGRKADIVFEVTGNASIIPEELKVLKNQGRFVVVSSPRGKTSFDFHDLCNGPSFRIIGSHNNSHPRVENPENPWTKDRHNELFFDFLEEKRIEVASLISRIEPYTEASKVYKDLIEDRGREMAVLFDWN